MVSRKISPTASLCILLLITSAGTGSAFITPQPFLTIHNTASSSSNEFFSDTALYMGKSRKARRMDKQQVTKSRPQQFWDAIDETEGKEPSKTGPPPKKKKEQQEEGSGSNSVGDAAEEARQARAKEAQARMDARPDVSTMMVDEESGMEVLAQGKNVMDVVTRKAVKLSNLGPEYRLAQMFPGVPPKVRDTYRWDWKTVEVPDMIESLREACSVTLEDGNRGIPPHPSIANRAIDFVLANRDRMRDRMKRTLGRITMRSASLGNKEEAAANQQLWKHFMTLENHISAPFRQMIMDAEGRVGPNFGNLDVQSYCSGHLYERCANYLVLKGMVAHWEKKVVDADYVEKTPQTKDNYISLISRGDPRRYLPDPPILFSLKECTQVCYMAQQMTKTFVETEELFNDLPPELRFVEKALTIQGGTALRQWTIEEFCPAEEITPEGLREGLRRLVAQLENMQVDPYADICNILERLVKALEVGTDDTRDPYAAYLANKDAKGPGRFQTYTFNHEQLSLVRFLDNQYEGKNEIAPPSPAAGGDGNPFGSLFNFGGGGSESQTSSPVSDPANNNSNANNKVYKVPQVRAVGRPHELGWLDDLTEVSEQDGMPMGKVQPGVIIPDDEE